MSEEILVARDGGLGRLTLNRPQALHALTTVMCSTCITVLSDWRRDPAVQAVLIDHSGERGFCAGGDIRMLADSGASDGRLARAFFFTEYRLNHLLFSYPKPVIAVMDGITMGGGVGLSAPARYRLATERTTFAMPETGIGLFPDVGGGWFLPRLPGRIGLWLALTGARIKAADCLHAGLASHHVPSERLPELKAALARNPQDFEALLAQFHVDPGPAPLLAHRAELDAAFGQGSVEAILAALETGSDWARAQALALRTKSPQTLKVAFRQLALGLAAPDFIANMAMEYRIGARVVQRHDFLEGVRAVIVDKDNAPKWDPATLEGVGEDLLDAIFAPLPADQEWSPLPGI